jgi:hypothetical protein
MILTSSNNILLYVDSSSPGENDLEINRPNQLITNQVNSKFVENLNTNGNYLPTNTNTNQDNSNYKSKDEVYKTGKSSEAQKQDLGANAKIGYLYNMKK